MFQSGYRSILWITGVILFLAGAPAGWAQPNPGEDFNQPLTLEACLRLALKTNPLPQAAQQGVQAAKEASGEAFAPFYPELGIQTRYAYWQQRAFLPSGLSIPGRPTPKIIGPTDDWMAGFRTRYTLFDSGERQAQYKSALARQGLAEEEKTRVIQDLLLAVHQGFYGLAAALETRQVAEKNLLQIKAHLNLAKERKAAGAVPLADVLRVQVEVANAELALVRTDSLVSISKGNLNTVMGLSAENPLKITVNTQAIPSPDRINLSQVLEEALKNRPELKSASKRIEVSKGGVDLAKSAFGPKVRAEGSYGWRDNIVLPREEEWLAGVSIEWPLFTGFFRQHRLDRAKAEQTKEEAEARQQLLRVRQEVWTAHSKLTETYQAIQATQALVQDARESLRLAQERYEVGAGTITDLLDAQTAQVRALATQVEAEWDFHSANATFQRSIGRLKPSLF